MEQRAAALHLIALGWERSDNNRVLKTFARDHYRFHFITGGKGYYQMLDETILLSEGEGFIIFPGETPKYYPSVNEPWEYFWIAVSGDAIWELVTKYGFSRASCAFKSTGTMDEMRQILADMCATSIVPLSIDRLFPYYLRDFFSKITPILSKTPKNSLYFEQCLAFITAHYTTHITVQDIADHINIDRTYLYKLFKKNLGMSPQAYLLNYQINKACDLLQSSQDSITDIAYNVGFRDYSDFSRQFKALKKTTPTAYRLSYSTPNSDQS